jgi:D-arabinose 1-dehydrogenase-like Zn-dependent alcohol dehydrogenase
MNPNEFERTKPTVTMQKINDLIRLIDEEKVKTEILYRDRVRSLDEINILLKDMKNSFKKGE